MGGRSPRFEPHRARCYGSCRCSERRRFASNSERIADPRPSQRRPGVSDPDRSAALIARARKRSTDSSAAILSVTARRRMCSAHASPGQPTTANRDRRFRRYGFVQPPPRHCALVAPTFQRESGSTRPGKLRPALNPLLITQASCTTAQNCRPIKSAIARL